MLTLIFDWLAEHSPFPGAGVFRYITFRAVLAAVFSLVISIGIGGWIIRVLKRRLIGETIRAVGPESHQKKKGTPTMGGLIILAAVLVPTLLWARLDNIYVLLIVLATAWMGAVGFADDYIKVFLKNKQGLKAKFKLAGQVLLGLIVGVTMVTHPDFQGPRSNVGRDGRVYLNDALRGLGFRDGDRLIEAGTEAAARTATGADSSVIRYTHTAAQLAGSEGAGAGVAFAAYKVERRASAEAPTQTVEIVLAPGDRAAARDMLCCLRQPGFETQTNIPFFKQTAFDYGWLAFWTDDPASPWARLIYVLMVTFIVAAVSNAVNITDGLDGLAAGTSAIVAVVLGIFAYVSGNIVMARYLNIAYIPYAGELLVFAAALIGGCVGFLWYNCHPAQVFMGDTGSLALGGAVGVLALMVKVELLLPIVCGVFFVEILSVMIQVSYFRWTKKRTGEGRRIFRMAPLHHHYELGGLHESKIVTRFWIVTVLLAIVAFATLKLR